MCRFLATTSLSSGCTLSFGTEPSTPPRPQDPPDSLISSYRESGSSWSWTAYPHAPKFAPADQQLRCLSCYQYASPHLDPAISNFELTELGVQQWLDANVLSENGEQPCGGYKILQINIRRSSDIPVRSETFLAITKAFGVPPVELHISSTFQGGCGMFSQDDGSFGISQLLWLKTVENPVNVKFSIHSPNALCPHIYVVRPPLRPKKKHHYGLHPHRLRLR
jgi:hypothetical protein